MVENKNTFHWLGSNVDDVSTYYSLLNCRVAVCQSPTCHHDTCWLAMPLGAGFLRWVLACHTIEEENKKFDFSFFSLLYGTPAPSAESQHPEAWPASTYGELR